MRKSEYPKEAKTLGQKIRKRRMDLKLSLDDLTEKTDVTASYLSRIEADKKVPTVEVAGKIAKALNVSPEEYLPFLIKEKLSGTISPLSYDTLDIEKLMRLLNPKKKTD